MEGLIAVTYRCNARCVMCNIWQHPTKPAEEISPNDLRSLPPCNVGTDLFFIDPFGEVRPCNGMEVSMGSLKEQSFDEIWHSAAADEVRRRVATCDKGRTLSPVCAPQPRETEAKPSSLAA